MLRRCLATWLLLTLPPGAVAHEGRQCLPEEARSAEEGADRVRNWAELYQAYRRFGHCDSGAIAEGYSDRVVEMLAHKWKTLPQLNALVSVNPEFGEFIIRHIDLTAIWASAQKAELNAKSRCPKQAATLCARIASRVEELRRDAEKMR